MLKTYIADVVEICENGDAILQFPPGMCEELGWAEGDTLSMELEDGVIVIEKINKEDKDKSLDINS